MSLDEVVNFLNRCQIKLDEAIARAARPGSDVISTYFTCQASDFECRPSTGSHNQNVVVNKFSQSALPLFLEGPVHHLRLKPGRDQALRIAEGVRNSGLFDRQLMMYKVNESLANQPMEIGRARVFSPGWFENESVWLHMQYKYWLELCRNGLFQQFFDDAEHALIPFQDPRIYGRSILENSSFIVSSANPDPSLHGTGFVARLSGATIEFMHIMQLLTVGEFPFVLDASGDLVLILRPSLNADWFTRERSVKRLKREGEWHEIEFEPRSFSFMFLGETLVTYHNPALRSTYGEGRVSPRRWQLTMLDGSQVTHVGETLNGNNAQLLRSGGFQRVEIWLE